mmetsp:Transcript_29636/g.71311  ORF Transcript_29636/g.71311 Transcript_29636/m.71311 type:complete len:311 (-) Transcript_29636:807-1739(-)
MKTGCLFLILLLFIDVLLLTTFWSESVRIDESPNSDAACGKHSNLTVTTENETRTDASIGVLLGWKRPPQVFAHVHIAKTAGTSINGRLAGKYERICGHKGYSYDYYQYNEREKKKGSAVRPSGRGKVRNTTMYQIGYEDCDWISIEGHWHDFDRIRDYPLEFHIPCREPISHLLSECNHLGLEFNCESSSQDDLIAQIEACDLGTGIRFSSKLAEYSAERPLKCFDPFPIDRYMSYMGNILQSRRFPVKDDAKRITNLKRNKTLECLWQPEYAKVKATVTRYLFQMYEYYRFCDSCIGTSNDLFEQNMK